MTKGPDRESRERERLQRQFDAMVGVLTTDAAGAPREEAEFQAYADSVRAALDSLAHGVPMFETMPSGGSLAVGTVLANTYVVRALIGTGGTSEVYQVRHRDLQGDYAVKILRPDRARDRLLGTLFSAEARALMALRHDGIVRCYALLRHGDGRPFMVLDLARGPTLAETLAGRGLDRDELDAVAYRLATSLAALHAAGYVHGDLSPENVVLIGGLEGAVLLDLGLASANVAGSIAFAGKWSSAAPEQLEGGPASPEADLYAFGLLLSAALLGMPLALGSDRESAWLARRDLPLDHLPPDLRPLIRSLVATDPRARPSAAAVARHFAPRSAASPWRAGFGLVFDALRRVPALRQFVPGSKIA